ncbi:flagellar basal body-associated FliL family protein [Hydrogenibacillus sp. N12]|uniref:flagellar basal body-associated FliL family protein n=1 Tax=Hydrogenibacillus sp. N12 TaxID=2866627 RepID=UPI001A0D01E4|nr:flagellar basal body-associated FliL family protein [Hydrogenibacillus sp. N12]MBE3562183.1 flagellar basal body-associated FliL family protein [Hydrogenibacillus schlegelii]QZA33508.1 flagellar basal body-associated FliL family protein [Hydrogenibacillus sp. N12]
MRQRLIGLSVVLIVAIGTLAVVTALLWRYVIAPPVSQAPARAEEGGDLLRYAKYSVETGDLTTDLKDKHYILLNLTIMTDSKKAADALAEAMFIVKREVIGVLSEMTSEELLTEQGVAKMEAAVAERLRPYLPDGKILKVATTKKVIQ